MKAILSWLGPVALGVGFALFASPFRFSADSEHLAESEAVVVAAAALP